MHSHWSIGFIWIQLWIDLDSTDSWRGVDLDHSHIPFSNDERLDSCCRGPASAVGTTLPLYPGSYGAVLPPGYSLRSGGYWQFDSCALSKVWVGSQCLTARPTVCGHLPRRQQTLRKLSSQESDT